MKVYNDLFEQIVCSENLFRAWDEFRRGKQAKTDVMKFEWRLEANIFDLHRDLVTARYRHGSYYSFYITDPKQRLIHKALVRDRVLHHAIFKVLNPIFEPTFIDNSFSCRVGKGTHKGVKVLSNSLRQVSRNNTGPCYGLKCDIYKFFASIDHTILMSILGRRIKDEQVLKLLAGIVASFSTKDKPGNGLPIGNLTSQLFANVYMNELDQFIKHSLKVKHYVRYTDDFIIINNELKFLETTLPQLQKFLLDSLRLELHPQKITIRKYNAGIDFLGYVILPHRIQLRTKTKRRLISRANYHNLPSYLGVLSHANTFRLRQELLTKLYLDGKMLE